MKYKVSNQVGVSSVNTNQIHVGKRNLRFLYVFSGTSRLWFDGGLWVVYFQHQGLSLFQIGLLEALLHVVAIVSDVPLGAFADRFGWKLSLASGTFLGVGYTLLALFANNPWLLAVAFAARGLQVTLTNGSDSSLAYESAKWAQIEDRFRIVSGRLLSVGLVSMGIAEAAGGFLASMSWSAVYVAFTLANVASFFVVLWVKEPRHWTRRDTEETEHPSVLRIVSEAWQFARREHMFVRWIVLSGTLSGFIATFAFYGQAILLNAGWTLVSIGILMGLENGIGALAALSSDYLVRFMGEVRTMYAVGILAATGLILFVFLPGTLAGGGYLLDSIAGNAVDPVIEQGLNQIVPTAQRATLMSANSTAFSLFMIAGFPLFGYCSKQWGLDLTSHAASIFGALSIMAAVSWWATQRKRTRLGISFQDVDPKEVDAQI